MSSRSFKSVRDVAKAFNKLLPSNIRNVNAKLDEYARGACVRVCVCVCKSYSDEWIRFDVPWMYFLRSVVFTASSAMWSNNTCTTIGSRDVYRASTHIPGITFFVFVLFLMLSAMEQA